MPVTLDQSGSNIFAGGDGSDGDLVLRGNSGQDLIRLEGSGANVWLGGNGQSGDILIFNAGGDNRTFTQATIRLDGENGNVTLGGSNVDGDLTLRSNSGQNRIRLDGNGANGWFGGNGEEGNILLFAASGDNETTAQATIHLDGGTGDITLRNADCAEDFPVENPELLEPGTVVAIGENSRLCISDQAYNRRVAGIIAGAGDLKPGIILGRDSRAEKRLPVALVGRAYCKVDATYGAIAMGDLLTTSPTPGHAMKVLDPLQAFGAVIGKAFGSLDQGTGLIPVLIALQ